VWLEVFLLAGVNGFPSEAGKIADAARRIASSRIQRNTVVRPPAEDYACAVSALELAFLREFFPGVVDILPETGGDETRASSLRDIGEGDVLVSAGKACTVLVDGRIYYSVSEGGRTPEA